MVPFEIPEIPIVVTGRLETFNCGGGPGEGRFAGMDHSLLAELSLSYSRHWSKSTDVGSEKYALNITYEVHASPEMWLIGGQRKGHFSAKVQYGLMNQCRYLTDTLTDPGRRSTQISNHPAASEDGASTLSFG